MCLGMVRASGALDPKRDDFIKALPQGSEIYAEEEEQRLEPEVLAYSKETMSPRYNRTDAHIHSQLLWHHAQGLQRLKSNWADTVLMPVSTKLLF